MCGICGIFHERVAVRRDLDDIVGGMMDRLSHRGPDGQGRASGPGYCVGHRRLAIIDLQHGGQPMASPDGRHVLVYNGELYNYLELRQQLIQDGAAFRTFSDTEVLLQMLVEKGAAALRDFNGMFAFALIDGQTGEWLLARDPFGIKPLYYATVDGDLAFASEIKALLVHPGVRASLDWNAFEQYLTFQFCLHGRTLFEGISAVEPGCYLRGRGGEVLQTVRYWDTDYQVDEHHTDAYFKDRLLYLLEDSARLQIRSDVPLGAYVSGGIDSSVVASMAAEHLGRSIPVFHGRFAEGPAYDESEHARAVAQWIGADYHEAVPTASDFVDLMPRLIYHMDEPVAGPGLFPQYVVSRLAAQRVKVVLGGQGGDEIFGGYARYLIGYLEQALKGAVFQTQEEGRHIVTLASIIPNLPLLREYQPLMQHFLSRGLFEEMGARYFRLIDRGPAVQELLTDDARQRLDRDRVFADFERVFHHADTQSYFNKMTHFDQKTLLPALLQVEDRMSMAVSLESRVPLLDTRVANLVTTMPPPMKFQGGRTKHIFRQAVSNLLPQTILSRSDKMGFPVPLSEWMRGGPVRDFVGDLLSAQCCRQRGLFRPEALRGLIDREARFGRLLWGILCLELWHRQFLDAN
jgi:asparagine synthase (glutamine-hydrolysing)